MKISFSLFQEVINLETPKWNRVIIFLAASELVVG